MALTKDQAEKKLADGCERLGLELEVNYVNKQRNVPDTPFTGGAPTTFTVHETANPNAGADARMHRNFVKNGGGAEFASYTLSVDSKRAVLIIDLTKAQYHAGTERGNNTSGSVETCVNSDGDWGKTKDNLAKLIAAYCYTWSLPVSAVVQHNIWYGKNCPATIRREGSWAHVIGEAARYLQVLQGTPKSPIQQYWEAWGGVGVFGLPVTAERHITLQDGKVYWGRLFERYLLHLDAQGNVQRGLLGSLYLSEHPELLLPE